MDKPSGSSLALAMIGVVILVIVMQIGLSVIVHSSHSKSEAILRTLVFVFGLAVTLGGIIFKNRDSESLKWEWILMGFISILFAVFPRTLFPETSKATYSSDVTRGPLFFAGYFIFAIVGMFLLIMVGTYISKLMAKLKTAFKKE